MHELQITNDILTAVLKHADRHRVRRVVRIHLTVGELNDLQGEWMQEYFDHLSEGTTASGAVLVVERVPAGFLCHSCDAEFDMDLKSVARVACPECGGCECSLNHMFNIEYPCKVMKYQEYSYPARARRDGDDNLIWIFTLK